MADVKPKVAVYYGKEESPNMLSLEELSLLMNDINTEGDGAGDASESEDSGVIVPEEKDTETTNTPVGSVSEVKNIYKSSKDKDGMWTWVNKYPEDVAEPAENAVTDTYAVLVRNVKSQDGRKKLEAHSIVVQSPWLQKALRHVRV